MRSYPSKVVGLPYEGRAEYVFDYVDEGDNLILVSEPQNPQDSMQ